MRDFTDQRGITYLGTLIAVAIVAILGAVAYIGIGHWAFSAKEATTARGLYRIWGDWTSAAITEDGATLSDSGAALTLSGNNGYTRSLTIPSGSVVNLNGSPFTGHCQSLNGYGIPVTTAATTCETPALASTTSIPKLSDCFAGGDCVGAHS